MGIHDRDLVIGIRPWRSGLAKKPVTRHRRPTPPTPLLSHQRPFFLPPFISHLLLSPSCQRAVRSCRWTSLTSHFPFCILFGTGVLNCIVSCIQLFLSIGAMDLKLVPGYLKSYATATAEDKDHEVCYGNYHRVRNLCVVR